MTAKIHQVAVMYQPEEERSHVTAHARKFARGSPAPGCGEAWGLWLVLALPIHRISLAPCQAIGETHWLEIPLRKHPHDVATNDTFGLSACVLCSVSSIPDGKSKAETIKPTSRIFLLRSIGPQFCPEPSVFFCLRRVTPIKPFDRVAAISII